MNIGTEEREIIVEPIEEPTWYEEPVLPSLPLIEPSKQPA